MQKCIYGCIAITAGKVILLAISLCLMVGLFVEVWIYSFFEEELWFDEAYNLEIVYNLISYLQYRTHEGNLFNIYISTGPSVLLLVYIANLLGGTVLSVSISHLAIFFINLLIIVSLFFILYPYGRKQLAILYAVACFIVVFYSYNYFPSLLYMILGEGPAFAYIVTAIGFIALYEKKDCLSRRSWGHLFIAGMFIGLAVNAKWLAALSLPSFFLGFMILRFKKKWIRELLIVAAGFLIVVLGYELIKYVILSEYVAYSRRMLQIIGGGASSGTKSFQDFVIHAGYNFRSFVSTIAKIGWVVIIPGSVFVLVYLLFNRKRHFAVLFFLIYGVIHMLWFCFISQVLWERYVFFGLSSILCAFLLAIYLFDIKSSIVIFRRLASIARNIAIFIVIICATRIGLKTMKDVYVKLNDKMYIEQVRTRIEERNRIVEIIKNCGEDVYSGNVAWFNPDKEVSVFLGKNLKIIDADENDRKGKMLLVTQGTKKELIQDCEEIVVDGKYYGLRRF